MAGMEEARAIDPEHWPRREHFEHYLRAPCAYSITVELDVSELDAALERSARKSFLAHVWALAEVVNRHDEFKMTLLGDGEPAVWARVDPLFTVFNPERETFAGVLVPYDPDFGAFHDAAAPLLAEHRRATRLFPQGAPAPNAFYVSSLPWTSFTGFDLQLRDEREALAPIFTLGRSLQRSGRTLLPLAVRVHHAAADGFHTARLLDELQELCAEPGWLR